MTKAAVICEFNPFHNGHLFLLEKIKKEYADEIVCIMSGNFVQRGDIAVTDKYTRSAAALAHGADMVAELPTAYAVSSAQTFAKSGVMLAHELGCDMLCFGVESDPNDLQTIADAICSDQVNRLIAYKMHKGLYYPRAVEEAIADVCSPDLSRVLTQPNNILAIEYIRACVDCKIRPVGILRRGVNHDSNTPSAQYASASYIRELIASDRDYRNYTDMTIDHPASLHALESAILYRLKTMSVQEIASLADVSEGLEYRIADTVKSVNSIKELLSQLKTKRYTMSRLRRILVASLLGISAELQQLSVPYIRVLGIRSEKQALLTSRSLPLIVRVKTDYDTLNNSSKEIFQLDLRAAQAMNIAAGKTINEFSQPLIKI